MRIGVPCWVYCHNIYLLDLHRDLEGTQAQDIVLLEPHTFLGKVEVNVHLSHEISLSPKRSVL